MVLFCSAGEFESLCRALAGKAELLRFQAKGGSMYPFIRSGDWVDVALCRGAAGIRKGEILLFKKENSLYLHRVLRRAGRGFLVKGDMSLGSDGVIDGNEVLARVVSVQRGASRIDLNSALNRLLAVLAADSSLFLQYPLLFARKIFSGATAVFFRIQGLKAYRVSAGKILKGRLSVRSAGEEDEEALKDLYRMSGQDIRDGLAEVKSEGAWLVAEYKRKVVAGLTMTRCEFDPALWVIFGLEVKPVFRGLGAGRAIVKEALAQARRSGAARIGLFVNKGAKPALGLYRSLGFQAMDVIPAEFNRSADELYLSHELDHAAEWSLLLEKSLEEGVFYPLYRNLLLSAAKDTVIPPAIRERFRQIWYLHLSQSGDFISRVERVLEFLESRKIKVLIFKGAAVDQLIYGDFLRPRLDLDIAVRAEDMAVLERALQDYGYTSPPCEKDYPLPEYLNSRLFISQSGALVPLHVHKHLINNMFLTVDRVLAMDMEDVWEESEPFKDYRYIQMLKPELNIIYLCEHGLKHDFDQMVFLYEIERLLGYYGRRFDWKKFVGLTRSYGLGRPVFYGLYFVRELLSGRPPQEVLEALKPAGFTRGEKLFTKDVLRLKHRRYASYPVYCAMRPGFFKKTFFIFRTVFPPGFTLKGYLIRLRRLILAQ